MSARVTATAGSTVDMTGNAMAAPGALTTNTVTLIGSPGSDILLGEAVNPNIITATGGTNDITGGSSADTITGGEGADTIDGADGNDTITGNGGNDIITGGTGNDTITGDAGNDTINSESGTDTVSGGAGNDTVTVSADASLDITDTITGGDGTDMISLEADMTDSAATLSRISGFETLQLVPGAAEAITMSNFVNNSFATVNMGDAGGNRISLTNAPSSLTTISVINGATGDSLTVDRLIDNASGDAMAINMATTAGAVTIPSLIMNDEDTLTISTGGTDGADDLTITDAVLTNVTSLTVTGAGDLVITNELTEAIELATLDFSGSSGAIDVDASQSLVAVTATAGSGAMTVETFVRADTVTGGAVIDTITTSAGDDTINAGAGNDIIDAGADNDTIDGGTGDDEITGGSGTDTMTSGSTTDADDFNFAAGAAGTTVATFDIITDFVTVQDDLDFTGGGITAGDMTVESGAAYANLAGMVTRADAIMTNNGAGNVDNVVAFWNAAGSGDAYVLFDADDNGSFDATATDFGVILRGINLATEIAVADLI
jgi:Ca2+-binding RTX toxin-like protein